jgi:hypothetical protein
MSVIDEVLEANETYSRTHELRRLTPRPAPDTGRYQHLACASAEIFGKGDSLVLCTNPKCPNKGANWALQEKLT